MPDIPLFPLGNALFPAGVMSLRIFEVRYLDMVRKCIASEAEFGIVPLLAGSEVRVPEGHETLATAGTLARIELCSSPGPGLMHIRCTGTTRFHLTSSRLGQYGLWNGSIEPIADDAVVEIPTSLQPCANALGRLIAQLQQQGVAPEDMPMAPPFRLDECGWVADRWAELLPLAPEQKAALLTTTDPVARLYDIYEALGQRGLL